MNRTIYIRHREAGFSVVTKPVAPGMNNLHIPDHASAAIYAAELRDRLGCAVVDETPEGVR